MGLLIPLWPLLLSPSPGPFPNPLPPSPGYCLCSEESHTFISSIGFLPIIQLHMSSWLLDISMWMPTPLREFILFIPHTFFLPLFPNLIQFREIQPPKVKTSVIFLSPLVQWLTESYHSYFSQSPPSHAIFIILCLCGHNSLKTYLSASTFAPHQSLLHISTKLIFLKCLSVTSPWWSGTFQWSVTIWE